MPHQEDNLTAGGGAPCNDDGFTLVEVMIAVVLLALGSVAFFVAHWNALMVDRATQHDQICMTVARTQLENIKAAAFSTIQATYDGQSFDVEGLRATKSDADGLPGQITVAALSPDLLQVTITIEYIGTSADETFELVGLISPY
ncbi:MAG: prepilin-type N-terminal cleavage/methylation domain-containing protein [Planctomycetes bacterium]|nr:prepilin-type N-terminal cleavage/methylation domain-containing protein [Planctomycetota bacterium]